MTDNGATCPVLVMDCDALNYLFFHMRIGDAVIACLERAAMMLQTIRPIYRTEAQDALRELLDRLVEGNRAEIAESPHERALGRKERKLARKVRRKAQHSLASSNDQALLLLACFNQGYLMTGDQPLQTLARGFLPEDRLLTVLDGVDALCRVGELNDVGRENAFDTYPLPPSPQDKRERFEALSRESGGPQRHAFDCLDESI